MILANISLGARQIDFVVASRGLTLVIEAKGFTRPIRGGENGPWQVQVASGHWKDSTGPSNPYLQARDAALKLRDAMRSFAGVDVQYPAAALIFVPSIPSGSNIYSGDFKVSVTGINELDAAFPGRQERAWPLDRWKSFARHLGLTQVNSVAAACDTRLAEADALIRQYSAMYSPTYNHPESVVPYPCRSAGKPVSSEQVVRLIVERQADVLICGPSGCGKTLLAGQAGQAFSQHGGLAITIPIKHYSGNIRAVLDREVGLLCGSSATPFLRAAKRLNRPLLFVVDGYNECAAQDRPSLTRAITALARVYETNLLVTSQCPLARADLLPLHTVEVPLPTAETKTAIALNVTGGNALPNELDHLIEAVATGLEARLLGEVGRQLSRGGSRYALFDAFTRKRLGDMASDGIRLLSQVAGWLSERIAFSLSVRDLGRMMDLDREPHATKTRLLTAGLLTERGDRVSFAHEMFFHAFAAECVIRRAAGRSDEVLKALASPQHADGKAFIIGAIDDDSLRERVLEGLADPQALAACIAGACGRPAQEWAEARCTGLWERLRTEARGVRFRVSDHTLTKVAIDRSSLPAWTVSEHALFAMMSQRISEGHFLDEILETTGILDRRIAEEEARLRDEAREHKVALRSGLFATAYVFQSEAVAGITQIFTNMHGRFARTTSDAVARAIQQLSERNSLSFGQIYLLLMLSRGTATAAQLIMYALKTHWARAPYHLRLDLLEVAHTFPPANERERAELIAAVESLPEPRHVFLSSAIVEALQGLGALEDSEHDHITVVREAVREYLADPENATKCALAYGLYSAQFDHPYCGAYCEVIAHLPDFERKMLLTMAANGAANSSHFLAPLLVDLASFGDASVGDSLNRWTALPPTDGVCPQDDIAVFVVAHTALAQLGCPLPDRQSEADGHAAEALAACGAILYWCNRIQLDETTKRNACVVSLRVLSQRDRDAALGAIRHCEHAVVNGLARRPGSDSPGTSIVSDFPNEVAELCRRALSSPVSLVGYFRHYGEYDRQQDLTFAIGVMAQHGNSTDLGLLREYANDTVLGKSAIAAVRTIETRLTATGIPSRA